MDFIDGASPANIIAHFLKEYPEAHGTIFIYKGEEQAAASYSDSHIYEVPYNSDIWHRVQALPVKSGHAIKNGDTINITIKV